MGEFKMTDGEIMSISISIYSLSFQLFSEPTHKNKPIKSFPPVQKNDINFLHIGNAKLKLDLQPRKEAIDFWNKIQKGTSKEHKQIREEL